MQPLDKEPKIFSFLNSLKTEPSAQSTLQNTLKSAEGLMAQTSRPITSFLQQKGVQESLEGIVKTLEQKTLNLDAHLTAIKGVITSIDPTHRLFTLQTTGGPQLVFPMPASFTVKIGDQMILKDLQNNNGLITAQQIEVISSSNLDLAENQMEHSNKQENFQVTASFSEPITGKQPSALPIETIQNQKSSEIKIDNLSNQPSIKENSISTESIKKTDSVNYINSLPVVSQTLSNNPLTESILALDSVPASNKGAHIDLDVEKTHHLVKTGSDLSAILDDSANLTLPSSVHSSKESTTINLLVSGAAITLENHIQSSLSSTDKPPEIALISMLEPISKFSRLLKAAGIVTHMNLDAQTLTIYLVSNHKQTHQKQLVIQIAASTTIILNGQKRHFHEIPVGAFIAVVGLGQPDGTLLAKKIKAR